MNYQVVLPEYEGPLDLLLNLIDLHELDIYNIPIAFITKQYMDYLRQAEEIDLNLSSEFLVMAGTLLLIKAKTLLPRKALDEEEGDAAIDPRDELVEKLLAYRIYKQNADELKRMESSNTRVYYREVNEASLLALFSDPNPVGSLSPEDLLHSFQEVLRLMSARGQVITIHKETMSVNDRMDYVLERLAEHPGGMRFETFLDLSGGLMEIITTFLALLELLSKGLVWVRQDSLFGHIYVNGNGHIKGGASS